MGGNHSEVHQPITGKIYLSPELLPFKTQPSSRQQVLVPPCLNGTNQGQPPWFPLWNLPTEKEPPKSTLGNASSLPNCQGAPGIITAAHSPVRRYDFVPRWTCSSFFFSWRLPEHTSDSPHVQTLMGRWYPSYVLQSHTHPIPDTPYLHSDSQLAT